jgi:hypothetical protein
MIRSFHLHSRERGCEEIPPFFVMPAKAGIQASGKVLASLDSRFRGNDDVGLWRGFFHHPFRGGDGVQVRADRPTINCQPTRAFRYGIARRDRMEAA